jgi:hypothetical protein
MNTGIDRAIGIWGETPNDLVISSLMEVFAFCAGRVATLSAKEL